MSDDDKKRWSGPQHGGPRQASPYPISRLAAPIDLVDTAREIQKADALLGTVTGEKLRLIAEQIRMLQEQARAMLDEAQKSAELHRAECRFQKRVGHVYHLYRNETRLYFSMLSPEEWGGHPPHAYEGSYRLMPDMAWVPVEKAAERDAQSEVISKWLGSGGRGEF